MTFNEEPEQEPQPMQSDSSSGPELEREHASSTARNGHSTTKLLSLVSVAAISGLVLGGGLGISMQPGNDAPVAKEVEVTTPAEETPSSSSASPAPEAEPKSPKMSERGNLVKLVGESGGIGDGDQLEVEFTVTGITVDPGCTGEYPIPPKNGHFVKLDLEVTTSAAAQGDFSFAFWKWIRPDGTTANVDPGQDGNGYMCLSAAEQLPHGIGPAEKVVGSIVLDVTDPEGTLIAQPAYAGTTGSWYWEWDVPAMVP